MIMGCYRRLLGVAAVALFFTSFDDYSQRWGILPLYWIALFLAVSLPLLAHALLTSRLRVTPIVLWGAGYLLISIVGYFASSQTEHAYREIRLRILSVIFLLLSLFLFARPEDQRIGRIAVVFSVLLNVSLNVYELFHPLTFSTVPGRSSGLYPNVNQSGAALMLGLILGYGVVPGRLRFPFVLLTGVGILTTFSRSAMIGWVLTVLFFAVRSGLSMRTLRTVVVFGLMTVGFIFSPWWTDIQQTLQARGVLTLDVVQRLSFLSKGGANDASTTERKMVAQLAWQFFADAPFSGHGTGAFTEPPLTVGPHDIYLAMMVDHGIVGMFIAPLLLLATLWGVNRANADVVIPLVLFLALWGFFSHNLLAERYILLSAAIAAAMVQSARQPRIVAAPAAVPLAPPRAVAA